MTKCVVFLVSLLAVAGLLQACTDSGASTITQAEDEVFAIHNEVMPKIGRLMQLRKQLKVHAHSLDSMQQAGQSATASIRVDEKRDEALRLMQNLTIADSLMVRWMARYNGDTLDRLPTDQALLYLEQEKEKIDDVKSKIDTSIQQAEAFFSTP